MSRFLHRPFIHFCRHIGVGHGESPCINHTPSLLRQPRLFCEIKLNLFTAEVFDFDPRRYFRYLQQRGVKQIVHLRRRNLLRRLVSVRIAREGNIWHLYNNDAPVRRTVFINVDGVVDFDFSRRPRPLRNLLDKTAGDVKFFDKLLREHFEVLELWYEDHVERDPNVAAQAISGLFAVPYSHQQPRVRRQNAGPLDELITNFDDVRKTLRGTPHEYMLEE